jgi:hypothetical protein
MAHIGTMATRGGLLLALLLSACAGSHDDDAGVAGTGAAGTHAGAGAGHAGHAGTGTADCKREPKKHRALTEMCDHERAPSAETPAASAGCTSDAECAQGENGRCGPNNRGLRTCTYDECFDDGDCMDGPCVCATDSGGNNRCFGGNCATDADCGAKGYCSPSFGPCGNYAGVVAYYCHTCQDACTDDSDCPNGGYCAYEPAAGHWLCSTAQCVG